LPRKSVMPVTTNRDSEEGGDSGKRRGGKPKMQNCNGFNGIESAEFATVQPDNPMPVDADDSDNDSENRPKPTFIHRSSMALARSHRSNAIAECDNWTYRQASIRSSGMLPDREAMKDLVRLKLMRNHFDVTHFYKEEGWFQLMARSPRFEMVAQAFIVTNAMWIAVDTDHNKKDLLIESDAIFQFAEHLFCSFFFFEWLVRFCAFRRKLDGIRDPWFVFDSLLVFLMVFETWVMTIAWAFAAGAGTSGPKSLIKMARLLRLARMARMGRLVRAVPELMILMKGMLSAMRSVFFTLCLLMIILYLFGISLTQLTDKTALHDRYFPNVMGSMYTLLIYGGLLYNIGELSDRLSEEGAGLLLFFLLFVLLVSLVVFNMLTGVLCEVVSAVSAMEKEEMLLKYVSEKVHGIVSELDSDGNNLVSRKEFDTILQNGEVVQALSTIGVDVLGLVDSADSMFGEDGENVSFDKFMDHILQLRGTNTATVKDVIELRKLVHNEQAIMKTYLRRIEQQIRSTKALTHDMKSELEEYSSLVDRNYRERDRDGSFFEDPDSKRGSKASFKGCDSTKSGNDGPACSAGCTSSRKARFAPPPSSTDSDVRENLLAGVRARPDSLPQKSALTKQRPSSDSLQSRRLSGESLEPELPRLRGESLPPKSPPPNSRSAGHETLCTEPDRPGGPPEPPSYPPGPPGDPPVLPERCGGSEDGPKCRLSFQPLAEEPVTHAHLVNNVPLLNAPDHDQAAEEAVEKDPMEESESDALEKRAPSITMKRRGLDLECLRGELQATVARQADQVREEEAVQGPLGAHGASDLCSEKFQELRAQLEAQLEKLGTSLQQGLGELQKVQTTGLGELQKIQDTLSKSGGADTCHQGSSMGPR